MIFALSDKKSCRDRAENRPLRGRVPSLFSPPDTPPFLCYDELTEATENRRSREMIKNDIHQEQNKTVIGILAHVDAGKTTLSEAILHCTGVLRNAGRVDHGDAFLDNNEMERERGITIYSKVARFSIAAPVEAEETEVLNRDFILLDTPGHADFSTEMERTLQVLDGALLLISAADGVTGQVRLLWKLLEHYGLPTVLFVNKMDQPGSDRNRVLKQLRQELSPHCVDFTEVPGNGPDAGTEHGTGGGAEAERAYASGSLCSLRALSDPDFQEELAVCDEALMERYFEGEEISRETAAELVGDRKLFPVFFGSALTEAGVDALLEGLSVYLPVPERPAGFGARVYKISRDETGRRMAWMKITGGSLKVRLPVAESLNEKGQPEKTDQIRLYSGTRFTPVQEALAGEICAVTGLNGLRTGDGLGSMQGQTQGILEPVLRCSLVLPAGTDLYKTYKDLQVLEEEDPSLRFLYEEEKKEITVSVMGQVQREILQRVMRERLGLRVQFGQPRIIYRETIAAPAEGVGHFEPLRHYAEVHLLLEPGERGSGLVFENRCLPDTLATNWQRLVMTHLAERRHRGVLVGGELTDVRISLLTGKAHEKHTEGGDFRQATYRAVRQGLMMTESILLEPYYQFRLEVPADQVGRALTDLERMHAEFSAPDFTGEGGTRAVLAGRCAVAQMSTYIEEVAAYTRGEGNLFCTLQGYAPCAEAERIILESGYDPELDLRNTGSSVFCSHGMGTVVPWYEVRQRMHVDSGWRPEGTVEETPEQEAERLLLEAQRRRREHEQAGMSFEERRRAVDAADRELMAIFERTYGPVKKHGFGEEDEDGSGRKSAVTRSYGKSRGNTGSAYGKGYKGKPIPEKQYLLVDGYNIIYAWEELRALAIRDIKAARDRLMDILSDFAGTRKEKLILVFDAYKVAGGEREVWHYHNIDVIYTREAETADLYIEKAARELSKNYGVTVATSDAVEQVIIMGAGAVRMSAGGLREEVERTRREIREKYLSE